MNDHLKQASNKQYSQPKEYIEKRQLIEDFGSQEITLSEWTANHYDITQHQKILELGCGTGEIWQHLRSSLASSNQLTLTDYSNEMLEQTRSFMRACGSLDKVTFKKLDINDELPFEHQKFDVVMSHLMLYHANNMESVVSNIKQAIKTNGVFGVSTQYADSFVEHMALAHQVDQRIPNKGAAKFTVSQLEQALKNHFSKVNRYNYTNTISWKTAEPALQFTKMLISISMHNPSEEFYQQYHDAIEKIIASKGSFETKFKVAFFIAKK